MNIDGLKVFCDVVRTRSFSRGAQLNDISQSAASQAVLQIERRLGVRLIDRSRRPLTLTSEGRVFYEGVRGLIEKYFALEAEIAAKHGSAECHVTIASIYSVSFYDMNEYIRLFQAQHPKGQVRLEYLHPEKVYEKVLNDEADLGLVSFPRTSGNLVVLPWREEPMVLVCAPSHEFAKRATVSARDLNGQDFVAFDADLAIRRYVDRELRQRNVLVQVRMEFDNIEAIKRAVEAGAGVSILPAPTVRSEVDSGKLMEFLLAGIQLTRPLSIIHRKGKVLSPGLSDLLDLLRPGYADGAGASREYSANAPSMERDRTDSAVVHDMAVLQ